MISVILCTYNRSGSLKKTLDSLLEMQVPPALAWELIVVDNNSTDETGRVIERFSESSGLPVRYLFQARQGLSYARNFAIQEARGEIVAFIDDDATVDSHWLGHLTAAFDDEGCVGVAGKIVPVWTCEKPPWFDTKGPHRFMKAIPSFDLGDERREIKTPPFGANMAFRRSVFKKYGLFRTDLGRSGAKLGIGEDTEFGRRLIRTQERLLYAPKAVVYHAVERQRTEKRYFQSWYFNYGRSVIRAKGGSNRGGRIGRLGTLLWALGAGFRKWAISRNPKRRFYYKLQLYKITGEIVELIDISRKADGQRF